MERAKLTGCHDLFCFLILFVSWGVFGPAMTFGTQAASESILCSMQVDARLIPWKNLEIPWNPWNVGMTCGCTWPHQCDLLHPSESGTPGNPIAFRGAEWLWRHGGGTAMWTKPFECEAWESLFWWHVFLLQMFLSVTFLAHRCCNGGPWGAPQLWGWPIHASVRCSLAKIQIPSAPKKKQRVTEYSWVFFEALLRIQSWILYFPFFFAECMCHLVAVLFGSDSRCPYWTQSSESDWIEPRI